ncbi:hypothetical protein [Paraburkholderia sp. C35]|uniref:hypothetical protein n=1 Tax=Paraburkholderia sp. C35 TaxID=2126993 RepID=UPI0013A5B498|nr:hypothetical protein [Paraburkholderia sp. C35]
MSYAFHDQGSRLPGCGFYRFVEQRIIVVPGFIVGIDGFGIDGIQRCVVPESPEQIGVGDKMTCECCSIAFTAFDSLFGALFCQPFVEDKRAVEDAPDVAPDALIATTSDSRARPDGSSRRRENRHQARQLAKIRVVQKPTLTTDHCSWSNPAVHPALIIYAHQSFQKSHLSFRTS